MSEALAEDRPGSLRSIGTISSVVRASTLQPDPHGLRAAACRFHDEVFAAYGDRCYWIRFCLNSNPAEDAAHVLSKSKLGKYRYATVEFARPAHRRCHERQHEGDPVFQWDEADHDAAVRAHNALNAVRVRLHVLLRE